jgi:YidC/Oxa1 family membrane protein insertase
MSLFHEVLYRPLFNLLIWLYDVIPGADIGFAIIALTVVVKLALWPLTSASLKSQKALQDLQPKLDELKEQHGDDKEKLAKAMMDLYAKEKVNPLSSCLPILVQIPILIALYQVLSAGLHVESLSALYAFVQNPGSIDEMFLGIVNLGERSVPLALFAGASQFWQTKMLIARRPPKQVRGKPGSKDEEMLASMNQTMLYVMPVMTTVIGFSLPGGLTLYWVAINVISIIQQYVVFRHGAKGVMASGS